jgi:ATP-dependent DNA helicase RecQ
MDASTSPNALKIDDAALAEKRHRDEQKLAQVIQWCYAKNCRQQWILRYFGESESRPCGKCDACTKAELYQPRTLVEHELTVVKKALSGVARMSNRIKGHNWKAKFGQRPDH